MKKLIALTLTLTCVCGLVGCKSNEPAIDSSTSKQETQQTIESTETTKQQTLKLFIANQVGHYSLILLLILLR